MKKKIFLILMLFQFNFGTMGFAQQAITTSQGSDKKAVEWVVVKESALDSVTLSYFDKMGWLQKEAPRTENDNVFISVSGYLANLLDETLSAVSRSANKFYDTPVGFWTTWGIFYHYVGAEFMEFVWEFVYILISTIFFVIFWRRYCVPRTVLTKEMKELIDDPKDGILHYELQKSQAGCQLLFVIIYFILLVIGVIMLCN